MPEDNNPPISMPPPVGDPADVRSVDPLPSPQLFSSAANLQFTPSQTPSPTTSVYETISQPLTDTGDIPGPGSDAERVFLEGEAVFEKSRRADGLFGALALGVIVAVIGAGAVFGFLAFRSASGPVTTETATTSVAAAPQDLVDQVLGNDQAAPLPTAAFVAATATPMPTSTPIPTATPVPTATPLPEPTPAATVVAETAAAVAAATTDDSTTGTDTVTDPGPVTEVDRSAEISVVTTDAATDTDETTTEGADDSTDQSDESSTDDDAAADATTDDSTEGQSSSDDDTSTSNDSETTDTTSTDAATSDDDAAGSVAAGSVAASSGDAGDTAEMIAWINTVRANVGANPLSAQDSLMAVSQRWAEIMAQTGSLVHCGDCADAPLPDGCVAWAENIGQGTTVDLIQNALAESPGHYRNMVNGAYDQVGVGVAFGQGMWWVTHTFGNGC